MTGVLAAMLGMLTGDGTAASTDVLALTPKVDLIDVYRFEDGWRWARIITEARARKYTAKGSWSDNAWLVLFDEEDEAQEVLVFHSSGSIDTAWLAKTMVDKSDSQRFFTAVGREQLGRVWPLAVEIEPDPDVVQFNMALGSIALPVVLPDRVWERMGDIEEKVRTAEDATEALRHAFDGLVKRPDDFTVHEQYPGDPEVHIEVALSAVVLDIGFNPGGPNADRVWIISGTGPFSRSKQRMSHGQH